MQTCRQNFSKECEDFLNKQINLELYAFHVYLELWSYFSREDIALKNVADYFKKASDEEKIHATKLIEYNIKRGGRYESHPINNLIDPPSCLLNAFEKALELEKNVNQHLLDLHNQAEIDNDNQLCDYIEGEFLKEQIEAEKELSDYITNIKRCGDGLGEFIFDKELL